MIRSLKILVPGLLLAAGAFMSVTPIQGKPEYAKAEKRSCVTCHVKAGSKELNDAGVYYRDHNHSLEGYKPAK
jgi:hypothetical protein